MNNQTHKIDFTRINNDTNGNPRYVCHYLEFKPLQGENEPYKRFEYEEALKLAKQLGGRKFHNKQYGGGIVFQSYNIEELGKRIETLAGKRIEYISKESKKVKSFRVETATNKAGELKKWLKFEGVTYSLKK